MHREERNTVLDDIGAAGLMPLDVRGLQADRHVTDAKVETAQGAPVLVSEEYGIAEVWVALPACSCLAFQRESNGIKDVLVKALRKVSRQQLLCNLLDELRILRKRGLKLFGKAPSGTGRAFPVTGSASFTQPASRTRT